MSTHEVRLLGVGVAAIAGAVGHAGVPDAAGVVVAIVVRERRVVGRDASRNVCSMGLLLLLELSRVLVEQCPVVVPEASTGGAHVLRGVDAGIWSRRRREKGSWVRVRPRRLRILGHEAGLGALPGRGLGIATVRLLVWARALDVGVDGGEGSEAFQGSTALEVLLLKPVAPVLEPRVVVGALIEVDVQVPRNRFQPLVLEGIELGDGNATDLGPRSVLEGVVVQELAAQEETNGQHPPHLTVRGLEPACGIEHVDATREVVHAEQDSGGGQSGRGEKPRHKLAKSRGDRRARDDQSLGHLRNVVGHLVYLVVQHRADTAGKHDGQEGGADEDWRIPSDARAFLA